MNLRPPERLEKTLARVAKEQGLAQERLRRWISFLALCGLLERGVGEGILENYSLKGGVALELRFAEGARATKDIDIGVPGERRKRVQMFQDAVALGFDEFTFQVKGTALDMEKVDAVRLEVGIRFRSRAWQTIEVDLGPSGSGQADLVQPSIPGLEAMGLTRTVSGSMFGSERAGRPETARVHRAILARSRQRCARHSSHPLVRQARHQSDHLVGRRLARAIAASSERWASSAEIDFA